MGDCDRSRGKTGFGKEGVVLEPRRFVRRKSPKAEGVQHRWAGVSHVGAKEVVTFSRCGGENEPADPVVAWTEMEFSIRFGGNEVEKNKVIRDSCIHKLEE